MENNNSEKKERQIDNLINVVENHTRTQRHLEQYSEIGNPKNKQNAREKQNTREKEIKVLKNQILETTLDTRNKQIENLISNYKNTEDYIDNNYNELPEEMLSNLENKQNNRVNQLENLVYDSKEGK
jgi:hypothetical protein